jgi:two-component system sensor histidine kinase TctE
VAHAPAGLSSRVRSAAALVSLKGALLLLLLPGLVIVLGMDIFISHHTLRRATDEAYDRALMGSVRAIEQGVGVENEQVRVNVPYVALEMFESTAHSSVYYNVQLLTPGKPPELLTGYDDLPQPPAALSPDTPHFYDALYHDDWVRVAVLRKPLYRPGLSQQVLIQVAETTETRQALRDAIWHNTFWRDLGVTVSAAALLWLAVAWALRPLARLHSEVASRRPDDLAPLDPRHVPREVRPLVEAINHHVRQHGAIADAQTRFLADAAHQLRTPLATLLIQAEYALREPDPARVRDSLRAVIEQLHRANRLTSQLLALGRAQHVERSEPTETFDLAECARQVMIDALPLARERQQDLGWDAPDEDGDPASRVAPPALTGHGNPAFIREALANLVHNAVAHTPRGGEITVSARRIEAGAETAPRSRARDAASAPLGQSAASTEPQSWTACDWALVTIDDNGPGIPEEQRARLFQRFERGQSATSGGSGLGLAIAREYAARYAGTIALDNRPEGGTRASLRLPIA